MITQTIRKRLAEIRSKLTMFSSYTDVSSWESKFFLDLLAKKDHEIHELKHMLHLRRPVHSSKK